MRVKDLFSPNQKILADEYWMVTGRNTAPAVS